MLDALILIARHIALAHDRWRVDLRRRPLSGEVSRLEERARRLEAENTLLRRRILRISARRRPYYRPWERLEILWHRARYKLSLDKTARAFAVTRNTVINWERALERRELRTVHARRALTGVTDLVAELAGRLKFEWPEWGSRRIAGALAQLGVMTSRSTVQRVLRRRPRRPTEGEKHEAPPVVAQRPNHVWFIDFTRVSNGFRHVFVGAVVDAYSRKVLSLAVAPVGADARTALRMVRHAVRAYGPPRWLVSDQGPEFTADVVARWLGRHGIGHRFGAVGRRGSVSVIERFWRSMKSEYARGIMLYRSRHAIERRLLRYVAWFNEERPHQGVDQRTPDQVFFRRRRRARRYLERGRLEVRLMEGDRRLPVLRLRSAA